MQLRTEIEICASPEVVWGVLTDSARYHEWNPFITTLEGRLAVGETLNVVVSPPDSTDFRFRPKVLVSEKDKELRWKGKVLADFIFCGEHYFELKELSNGRTRVAHGEDFSGMLLTFLGRQLTSTARGFVFMNQALKRRAEEHASTRIALKTPVG